MNKDDWLTVINFVLGAFVILGFIAFMEWVKYLALS